MLAGGATSQIAVVFEVWVVASMYEDDGQSPDEGTGSSERLPYRETGAGRQAPIEARAEVRDRETYYAELRFAVHCQSRSTGAIPAPRTGPDDQGADTWTHADRGQARSGASSDPASGTTGESWDEIVAHFDDTWT